MDLRKLSALVVVCAGVWSGSVVSAEAPRKGPAKAPNATVWRPPANAPNYGPQDLIYVRVNGTQMFPFQSSDGYFSVPGSIERYPAGGVDALEAIPGPIPSGAIIDYFELDYCDTNAGADVSATLLDCGPQGASCSTVVSNISSSGSGGCSTVSASGIGYTLTNAASTFDIEMIFGAVDGSITVGSTIVGYHLQVSPAPVSPTFADVAPDNLYYQFIEALAASGVTAGCDGVPDFCPDRNITRAEMAVFLAKALGLHFPN
jgi:hypothetical protein